MSLLRSLFFIAVKFQFSVAFTHIPGHLNIAADAISRFQHQLFFKTLPDADKQPTPIPQDAWQILHKQTN